MIIDKKVSHCKCEPGIKLPNYWLNKHKKDEVHKYCAGHCKTVQKTRKKKSKKAE